MDTKTLITKSYIIHKILEGNKTVYNMYKDGIFFVDTEELELMLTLIGDDIIANELFDFYLQKEGKNFQYLHYRAKNKDVARKAYNLIPQK